MPKGLVRVKVTVHSWVKKLGVKSVHLLDDIWVYQLGEEMDMMRDISMIPKAFLMASPTAPEMQRVQQKCSAKGLNNW
jgi:hypothetical protein